MDAKSPPSRQTRLKCPECPFNTTKRPVLNHHRRTVHPQAKGAITFACPVCPYGTQLKAHLARHLWTERHGDGDADTESLSEHRCHKCPNFHTYDKHDLLDHLREVHAVAASRITYRCRECDHRSDTWFNLDLHLKRKHLGPKKRLACPECPLRVDHPASLRRHAKTKHNRERTHYCWFVGCVYESARLDRITEHVESKHRERPVMGKNFALFVKDERNSNKDPLSTVGDEDTSDDFNEDEDATGAVIGVKAEHLNEDAQDEGVEARSLVDSNNGTGLKVGNCESDETFREGQKAQGAVKEEEFEDAALSRAEEDELLSFLSKPGE